MSLATYALTDYQGVLDRLGVSTYPQPGTVESMINSASRQIIKYSKREPRTLTPAVTVRSFPLSAHQFSVFMPSEPQSVSLVRVNLDGNYTTIPSTGYQLFSYDNGCYRSVQVLNPYGWSLGQPFLEVTGTWGWPAVTEDVKMLCEDQVVDWIQRKAQVWASPEWADSGEPHVASYSGLSYSVKAYLDELYSVQPIF